MSGWSFENKKPETCLKLCLDLQLDIKGCMHYHNSVLGVNECYYYTKEVSPSKKKVFKSWKYEKYTCWKLENQWDVSKWDLGL